MLMKDHEAEAKTCLLKSIQEFAPVTIEDPIPSPPIDQFVAAIMDVMSANSVHPSEGLWEGPRGEPVSAGELASVLDESLEYTPMEIRNYTAGAAVLNQCVETGGEADDEEDEDDDDRLSNADTLMDDDVLLAGLWISDTASCRSGCPSERRTGSMISAASPSGRDSKKTRQTAS